MNAVSYLAVLLGLWRMDPADLHRSALVDRFESVRHSLAEGCATRDDPHRPLAAGPAGRDGDLRHELPDAGAPLRRDTLALGADGYGALFATMGVGSLIGSLGLAFAASRRPILWLMLAGGVGFVIGEIMLGLTRTVSVAFPLILVIGLTSMVMVNMINVTIQHSVPNELRGRVMALYVTVFAGSVPIGGFFAGGVAELWEAPAGFVLGGALSVASSGWLPGSWSFDRPRRLMPQPLRPPTASERRNGAPPTSSASARVAAR